MRYIKQKPYPSLLWLRNPDSPTGPTTEFWGPKRCLGSFDHNALGTALPKIGFDC